MPTTRNETRIEVDQDVPLVRIIREFDAPPAKVFRAHTDPDLVVRWIGPKDTTMHIDTWDCRRGGAYRYVHVNEHGEHGFHGSFHDIRPPSDDAPAVLVQTFTYEGFPDGVALEKLVLEPLDGGTRTRLTATSLVDSFADRDAFVASGMESGVREGYEKLDGVLADASAVRG